MTEDPETTRNDYETGFRRGLEIAIAAGTRIAEQIGETEGRTERWSGGLEVVEGIRKVLADAK